MTRASLSRFRHFGVLAVVLAAATMPPAAYADIYKCLGNAGEPVYQDSACPPGRELRDFQTDPATVSVVPFAQPGDAARAMPAPASRASKREPANGTGSATSKGSRNRSRAVASGANAGERRFLHHGMSEAEVVARIGHPDIRSGNPDGKSGARWSYLPTDGDPGMITTLQFQSGYVSQIDRKPSR